MGCGKGPTYLNTAIGHEGLMGHLLEGYQNLQSVDSKVGEKKNLDFQTQKT